MFHFCVHVKQASSVILVVTERYCVIEYKEWTEGNDHNQSRDA